MKLRFEKDKEFEDFYNVFEDGIDTENIKYEKIGIICFLENDPFLSINENYTGIISLDEMQQIVKFMEEHIK